MDKSIDCLYCQRNELQKSLMIEICDLSASVLFLFKEQHGRLVAYKEHINEIFEMNPQKTYLTDAEYAETIQKIVNAL